MTETSSDNGNGCVTLADRLARIETKLDRALSCMDEHEQRLRVMEQGGATRETRLAQIEATQDKQGEAIDDLKSSRNQWGITNSVLAAIAGIVGWFR